MGETITKHGFGKGLGSIIYVEILGLINKTNQFFRIKRLKSTFYQENFSTSLENT